MAIVLEEKKEFPWGTVLVVSFFVVILFVGAYYLFFASTPGIEAIVPREQQNVSQLSHVKLDPSKVANDPVFQVLREYSNVPSGVQPGKPNPFVK